jgi:iron complex transport system substrate-binding protein
VTRIGSLLLVAVSLLSSCHNARNAGAVKGNDQSLATGRLMIDKGEGFTKVTVRNPWQNTTGTEHVWYLLPHDSPIPDGIAERTVIRVPVRKMICMSTTHTAMMRALGADSLIAGISGSSLVYDSVILRGISSGRIRDVGYEGSLNRELIIMIAPDLLMAYGVADPSSGSTARLSDLGVKVFYNADYLEEHPLARVSWIRLFGLLTGRERMADSIVSAVSASYTELASRVRESAGKRPGVLLGAPWEDVWYVSPANSYMGKLIEDAGGHYIYSDMTGANSVPFSVESVFRRAADAGIWINPGTAGTLAQIAAADHRMASLPLFSDGQVWNNRKRMTEAGGNDYWESAVVRPDLLLKDLVSIIHPELLPGYDQQYYIRLK